jgi:hypothetical protein
METGSGFTLRLEIFRVKEKKIERKSERIDYKAAILSGSPIAAVSSIL